MDTTVTIRRAEYERLLALERQVRLMRERQKAFHASIERRDKRLFLARSKQSENAVDQLLDRNRPDQEALPL
jgi:hypothetical protein